VYTPTDRLARRPRGAGGITYQRRPSYGGLCGVRGTGRLPANLQLPRLFAVVVGWASARIRLSLRINKFINYWGNLENDRGLFDSVRSICL